MTRKDEIIAFLKNLQSTICEGLEKIDDKATFNKDNWQREEGGGGLSRVIQNGNVFEKGGVNFSAVEGAIPAFLKKEIIENFKPLNEPTNFLATGVSIVIHPQSPLVPIIHMNIRYFESDCGVYWFGGGIDLTPHYIVKEDAHFFHTQLKNTCDKYHTSFYNEYKKWADDYFFIKHRKETRGIGGIFFDKLQEKNELNFSTILNFWKEVGQTFLPTYAALVLKTKDLPYNDQHKNWQLLRRGRYVEFNLVYDKGTKFGLETDGRIESILMSLPQYASWQYDYQAQSEEEKETLNLLKKGIDWVNL